MKFVVFIYICLGSFLFAEADITVPLLTKRSVYPVYLSFVITDSGQEEFSTETYLSAIRDILKFDFNCSGYVEVAANEKSKEFLLSRESFDCDFWKSSRFRMAVKLAYADKKLCVFIYDAASGEYGLFSELYLSGNLNEDRRKMHKLSDDILLRRFNRKGIAQTRLVYTVGAGDAQNSAEKTAEIWISDYDGGNGRRVVSDSGYCVTPVVFSKKSDSSPEFLYVSYKRGIPKIYCSGDDNPLISLHGNQLLPALSARKDKLAFICDTAGRPDLFLQKLDFNRRPVGKPLQLFSFPRATQASSAFSPDGKQLVFVSDKDGSPRIYLMKVPEDGERKRPYVKMLTKKNKHNVTPAWSCDGKKLAYSAKVNGVRQICIYDFESGEETQLTFGGTNKENPCWAEDNLHIVYNTDEKYCSELYVINLNNPVPVKIVTEGGGRKRFPSWER